MSAAIIGTLSLGMVGALVVVAKAAPIEDTATRARTKASAALDELCTELRYATAVRHLGATRIEFTLPDRTGDGVEETVEYRWAGSGSPLVRASGGVEVQVLPTVHDFNLVGTTKTTTTTTTTTGTVNSGEVKLAKFDGWPLVLTPTSSQAALHATAWASCYFKLDQVTIPANISRLQLTKIRVKLKKSSSPTGTVITAQVHLPATATKPQPSLTNTLGTAASISLTALTTTFSWYTFDLTGVSFTSVPAELTFVLKGTGTASGFVNYYNSSLAPTDTTVFQSTANSGGSWTPTSSQQVNDMLFEVWGWYEYPSTIQQSTNTYNLSSLAVTLATSTAAADRLSTTVRTVNKPSVPAP
ncbi:MAG TPA: hypothetical protein VD997_11455 [Phycisphaerales bacterium]|nr:hypothetical protein [Phycisphaerales bacterium]